MSCNLYKKKCGKKIYIIYTLLLPNFTQGYTRVHYNFAQSYFNFSYFLQKYSIFLIFLFFTKLFYFFSYFSYFRIFYNIILGKHECAHIFLLTVYIKE